MAETNLFEAARSVNEEWRPVVGFENWYSISSCGRLMRTGVVRGARAGLILKTHLNDGYPILTIHRNNKIFTRKIHTMVAEAFLGPRPEGMQINHIDGNKTNNNVANLEYITRLENVRHAIALGLVPIISGDRHKSRTKPESVSRGEDHANSKVTDDDVRQIRRMLSSGVHKNVVAEKVGMTANNVLSIGSRRTWRHVV